MSGGPDHDVIVIGAGPTGLFAAAELARLGLDVVLLEARPDPAPGSRAIGVHAPVLAALELSGATDRILADAARVPRGVARAGGRVLGEVRFDRLDTRFPFVATLPQARTEAAVAAGGPAAAARVTGGRRARPRHGRRRARAAPASRGTGRVGDPSVPQAAERLIARTVIVAAGAGGRHLVPAAGVRSHAYRDRYLMADVPGPSVESAEVAAVTLDAAGVLESFPLPGGGRRLVAWDAASDRGSAPLDDTDATAVDRLRRAVADRTGDDALAARIERVTGFGIRRAVARRLRLGRVFVVGDAAHEVSPIGGQGMNLGLLDVATLAPLIARWLPQVESSDELARWERQRLASARTAVRLAAANTALGRPRSALAHRVVTGALAGALSGPFGPMLARAYAMGLDRDGRIGTGRTAHGLTG